MNDSRAKELVSVWINRLGLDKWTVDLLRISPDQVIYEPEVPLHDRYFIGISEESDTYAIIVHDRNLTEEDIVHELTHLRFPKWSEDSVNNFTDYMISLYSQRF